MHIEYHIPHVAHLKGRYTMILNIHAHVSISSAHVQKVSTTIYKTRYKNLIGVQCRCRICMHQLD